MADPTIQAFCNVNLNTTDRTITLIRQFNTTSYNSVSLFSSTIGILGALYQILPRKEYSRNHRWISFSAERGRKIILWLSISDFLAALGVLLRAALWLNDKSFLLPLNEDSHISFCSVSSAWIQYFFTATWLWTLCYAIDMRFILREREQKLKYYHLVSWLLPAILTLVGIILTYFPNNNWLTLNSIIMQNFPNYFALYIPITGVMIANPILYHQSCKDLQKIIICTAGQFTKRERELIESIKIKFAAINLVFYACWFSNLVNGFMLWFLWLDLPFPLVTTTWYIMAFMNPLQAFFNCLVYRRWNSDSEIVILPWNRNNNTEVVKSRSTVNEGLSHDSLPLLEKYRESSYKSYT